MKFVKQKHKTGCGIAAVAMLAGLTYQQAIPYVLPNRKKHGRYSTNVVILFDALTKLKLNPKIKSKGNRKINRLKNNAIILIDVGKYNHAVVWDATNRLLLDPLDSEGISFDRPYKKHLIVAINYYNKHFCEYIEVK